ERLAAAGQRVIEATAGATYARPAVDRFVLPMQDANAFARLIADAQVDEVVHLLGASDAREDLRDAIDDLCVSALAIAQDLSRSADLPARPRLSFVTRHA